MQTESPIEFLLDRGFLFVCRPDDRVLPCCRLRAGGFCSLGNPGYGS